jgi:phage tail tape-measure protein
MVDKKTEFDQRSFKTVKRGRSGHAVVIGCPIGHWDPATKRCGVGTRAQSILHPLSEAEKYGFEPEELVAAGIPMAPPPEVIEVLENPDPYYYSSEAENVSPEAVGKGAGAAAEVASMAATGAAMGSVVPGVGTAIGAGAGAGAAVAKQAYTALKERKQKKEEAKAATQATKTAENPEPPQALIDARDLM